MKILLISVKSQISHGGIAVWTEKFLEYCKKKNIDVDVVNTEVVGNRLKNLNADRNLFDEVKRTKRILSDLRKCLKTNRKDYAVAHLNTSCGTFGLLRDCILAMIIKKNGIPLIAHYHCDIPYWVKKEYSKSALRKLASLSDKNVVLCENSKNFLKDNFGIESEKVPNFIEDSLIVSKSKEINDDIKKISFVGRVSRAKGACEIYDVADSFPQITFELIGEVSEEVAHMPKPENVLLTGAMPHDDLIKCIDDADLFIFPSHSEGFSLALTEAMARGLPCIVTDVGANKDMIEDKGGVIVPIKNSAAIVEAIKKLTDKSVRSGMSEWNVSKVKTNYLLDAVMEKLWNVYSDAVKNGGEK